jgi:hypothetical protein
MVTGPLRLWPVSDVQYKIQTRPLVRGGTLHEEGSTYQTKEHVKSGHGPKGWPDTKTYWPTDRRSQIDLHSTLIIEGISYLKRNSVCAPVVCTVKVQNYLLIFADPEEWLIGEKKLFEGKHNKTPDNRVTNPNTATTTWYHGRRKRRDMTLCEGTSMFRQHICWLNL